MNELYHLMGGDLALSSVNDMALVSGVSRTNQRLLRRMLTNPGDYIFHPDYGAGLPQRIGDPMSADEISAIVKSQVALEASVAQTPAPVVAVTQINAQGAYQIVIQYTDQESGLPAVFSYSPSQ